MLCIRQNIIVSKKQEKKWYSSTVLDLDNSGVIVAIPRINGEPMALESDDNLEISFTLDGVRYLFESAITHRFVEALAIEPPRLVERVELRRYPRVPVELEITYSDLSGRTGTGQQKKGKTLDLSGNGVRFKVDQIYTPNTYMSVSFSLPLKEATTINAQCRIVRIVVDHQKEETEYQLGAEFSRLGKKDQNAIIDYVINKLINLENRPEG